MRKVERNAVSVTDLVKGKSMNGIPGYWIAPFNATIDTKFSTKHQKSRSCRDPSRYYLDSYLRAKKMVPPPNAYNIPVVEPTVRKINFFERKTYITEQIAKAAKNKGISPATYKPKEYGYKIKGSLKQSCPRITMAEEFMTSDASKVPGCKYQVIPQVSFWPSNFIRRTLPSRRHPSGSGANLPIRRGSRRCEKP